MHSPYFWTHEKSSFALRAAVTAAALAVFAVSGKADPLLALTSEVFVVPTPDPLPVIVGAIGGPITIIPTYDASITSLGNAATVMAAINAAIAEYPTRFNDPITVNIIFQNIGSGLGSSTVPIYNIPYVTYRAALALDATSANDATALASLPVQVNSPADNQANMYVTSSNGRAIGLNTPPDGTFKDGQIGLNLGLINLDRVTINPAKYDLKAVVQHEIDEVLGLGSGLNLPLIFPRESRPQDLFRYSGAATRSYTTGVANAFLSIDGGLTSLVAFNENGGGDYGDWFSIGAHTPRVQDAFGTAGATPDLGPAELVNLDAIGYDTLVPEANPVFALGAGVFALAGYTLIRNKRQSR